MKIMSIGAGFVSEHLPYEKIPDRVPCNKEEILRILQTHKPTVLVNCIGKTGRPNIDWCESHKSETSIANTVIPVLLAEACAELGIHLIQIGSGCIFFGKSPNTDFEGNDTGWKEDDFANPKSYYSKSKYACDLALGDMDNVTTLRIRMPISNIDNQRNLINKLRGYKQLIDIPNSMTFMSDLVRCIAWVAESRVTGVYHVTNPEPLTAAKVMTAYQRYVEGYEFEIISESQLDAITVAKRSNCIINSDKLKDAGFVMTPSEEALGKCILNYLYGDDF